MRFQVCCRRLAADGQSPVTDACAHGGVQSRSATGRMRRSVMLPQSMLYRRRIEHIACIPPPLSLACFPVYTSGIGASCRPLLSSPLSPSFALLLITCAWLLVLARGMPSSTQSPRWELPYPQVLIICILNKNTYIYVFICIYISVQIYVHTQIWVRLKMYLYICIYIYTNMYIKICKYSYEQTCIFWYLLMYMNKYEHTLTLVGCIFTCIYICIFIFIWIRIYIYKYMKMNIYIYESLYECTYLYILVCKYMYIWIHTHIYIYTYIFSSIDV